MIELEKTPVQLRKEQQKTEIEAQLKKYFTPKWVAHDPRGEEYGTIEAKMYHSGFCGMAYTVELTLFEPNGSEKFTLKLGSKGFSDWLEHSNDAPTRVIA
jgi:hypothetical protein